ncbi:hypothetical protein EZS27_022186, partial [termite gut metagenome]
MNRNSIYTLDDSINLLFTLKKTKVHIFYVNKGEDTPLF